MRIPHLPLVVCVALTLILSSLPAPAEGSPNLALRKRARQSSTGFGGVAARAVDGKTNGHFFGGRSVSHTLSQQGAWWEVDLGGVYDLSRIVFYNRTDCCGQRLHNVDVIVYSAGRQERARKKVGQARRINTVQVNVRGRYVRLQLRGRNFLSLAEVQVFGGAAAPASTARPAQAGAPPAAAGRPAPSGNLALRKRARQSSTGFGGAAGFAVDGKTNGDFFGGRSVSHTQNQRRAWWEVDLGGVYDLSRVVFYNRTDCCGRRLDNVDVIVYSATRQVRARRSVARAQRVNTVPIKARGRYVRLQLRGKNFLSLAEVQVFGGPATVSPTAPPAHAGTPAPRGNLALRKRARQSSTSFNGRASLAVDGKTNGHFFSGRSVSHTLNQRGAWWEVDLGRTYDLSRVVFYNRTDCCGQRLHNVDVIVYSAGRQERARKNVGQARRINTVQLETRGRFVRLQLRGKNILSLAEVQVFGR